MIRAAKRQSLSVQTAAILREEILKGRLRDFLPGIPALCCQLEISPRTLRPALESLQKEGLIRVAHGRRTRIIRTVGRSSGSSHARIVRLWTSDPIHELSQLSLFRFSELRRRLTEGSFMLEVHTESCFKRRRASREWEKLVRQYPAACWVLHLSNPDIQRWFMERKLPAIVSKTGHVGMNLPSVDIDWEALGRHAAGLFLALGHRHVALLMQRRPPANEMAVSEGFTRAFLLRHPEAHPVVCQRDGQPGDISRCLGPVFHASSHPTGILVPGAAFVFTAMGYLAHLGIRIPRDVSLLAQLADSTVLSYGYPTIAHYQLDWNRYARRLAQEVIRIVLSGRMEARHHRLMPEFRPGNSLGYAPG